MTLVKFNPFVPSAVNNYNHFDKWVNNFFNDELGVKFKNTTPAVNIVENEQEYKLEIAAPGLAKEDFKVHVEDNVLAVSAEKKVENEEKTEKFLRREFGFTSFKRTFTLPENVGKNDVKAAYENGVLNINIPKVEVKKTTQTIDIQ